MGIERGACITKGTLNCKMMAMENGAEKYQETTQNWGGWGHSQCLIAITEIVDNSQFDLHFNYDKNLDYSSHTRKRNEKAYTGSERGLRYSTIQAEAVCLVRDTVAWAHNFRYTVTWVIYCRRGVEEGLFDCSIQYYRLCFFC